MIKIKRLNIFIDESGDFGFVDGSSDLYAVSFTLHESSNSINGELNYLNESLNKQIYNGQETLGAILDIVFILNDKIERRIDFNHIEKRLFQVSDMLTFIDKLDYKYHNNMAFTKAEKYFFTNQEIVYIKRKLKHKRL